MFHKMHFTIQSCYASYHKRNKYFRSQYQTKHLYRPLNDSLENFKRWTMVFILHNTVVTIICIIISHTCTQFYMRYTALVNSSTLIFYDDEVLFFVTIATACTCCTQHDNELRLRALHYLKVRWRELKESRSCDENVDINIL